MAIYTRACFQNKNEISDKLMRTDFNAISPRNVDSTLLRMENCRFANTSKLVDIGKFLFDEGLIIQIKYRSSCIF